MCHLFRCFPKTTRDRPGLDITLYIHLSFFILYISFPLDDSGRSSRKSLRSVYPGSTANRFAINGRHKERKWFPQSCLADSSIQARSKSGSCKNVLPLSFSFVTKYNVSNFLNNLCLRFFSIVIGIVAEKIAQRKPILFIIVTTRRDASLLKGVGVVSEVWSGLRCVLVILS